MNNFNTSKVAAFSIIRLQLVSSVLPMGRSMWLSPSDDIVVVLVGKPAPCTGRKRRYPLRGSVAQREPDDRMVDTVWKYLAKAMCE